MIVTIKNLTHFPLLTGMDLDIKLPNHCCQGEKEGFQRRTTAGFGT